MVIIGNDPKSIHDTKQYLHKCFEMKDLDLLRFFLSIEVNYQSNGLFLSQAKYASNLLIHEGLIDNKTINTPLEINLKLRPTDGIILANPS